MLPLTRPTTYSRHQCWVNDRAVSPTYRNYASALSRVKWVAYITEDFFRSLTLLLTALQANSQAEYFHPL